MSGLLWLLARHQPPAWRAGFTAAFTGRSAAEALRSAVQAYVAEGGRVSAANARLLVDGWDAGCILAEETK